MLGLGAAKIVMLKSLKLDRCGNIQHDVAKSCSFSSVAISYTHSVKMDTILRRLRQTRRKQAFNWTELSRYRSKGCECIVNRYSIIVCRYINCPPTIALHSAPKKMPVEKTAFDASIRKTFVIMSLFCYRPIEPTWVFSPNVAFSLLCFQSILPSTAEHNPVYTLHRLSVTILSRYDRRSPCFLHVFLLSYEIARLVFLASI